ncbi:response regulator transcription factor [Dechloromonas sp. XY25]|uniref:Response regulator transcription factor n=1 Tax=Dechloromonas hankyongensis TaxID=2908002 RepID=A0ABS9K6H8_9RHOO|nr:response regulator transcription factor [Dechloromonas hankyongensis]MCG2578675.1 response regulator transcription factor [Dechloromonas hankyongensis]
MLKILLADDHAVVRGGIRKFLEGTSDVELVAEVATGEETLAEVRKSEWDVLLLDISLPDLNGLEVLKRVKRERPSLPVLVFSMYSEDDFAVPAFDAGAAGYLSKDSPPAQILTAIQTVASGVSYVSPTLTQRLLDGTLSGGKRHLYESLSRREMEVLLMLSKGVSLTKIGEQLHLSVKTVSTYRSRVLEKLNLVSNADLTRYVMQYKLG